MAIAKVTAIIRPDALAAMEKKLHALGVPGMTISQV
jgi:nitrogen regulatory protein PII